MGDLALEAEVARLRDQVAKLEAARPADMEGFSQLNDAIVNNRLGAFIREKAQPKWLTRLIAVIVLAPFVAFGVIVIFGLVTDYLT